MSCNPNRILNVGLLACDIVFYIVLLLILLVILVLLGPLVYSTADVLQ